MIKNKKFKKSIELFHEKTGDVVRVIRFKNQKDFDEFIYGYRSMRYPGYKWRYSENKSRKRRDHKTKN